MVSGPPLMTRARSGLVKERISETGPRSFTPREGVCESAQRVGKIGKQDAGEPVGAAIIVAEFRAFVRQMVAQRVRTGKIGIHGAQKFLRREPFGKHRLLHRGQRIHRRCQPRAVEAEIVVHAAQGDVARALHAVFKEQ